MYKAMILVIEDDPNIAELIKLYCEQESFRVLVVADGLAGVEYVKKTKPDAVILDWMLPELEGSEVLKRIRDFSTVPVLMVTAKAEEIDKILGLELGADDYITKPFSPKELIARLKAILRRMKMDKNNGNNAVVKIDDLVIDYDAFEVRRAGDLVDFSVVELKLLYSLASEPGVVMSRQKLMEKIYDEEGKYVFDRTIDVHVKNVRKKLEDDPKNPRYIESVFGVGYKFKKNEN